LLLVLDSNEYIFAFGLLKDENCENLVRFVKDKSSLYLVRIPQIIVEEVRAHLTPEAFKEFILFINILTSVDADTSVPFELGAKYEFKGFKPADAFRGNGDASNFCEKWGRFCRKMGSDLKFSIKH